MTMRALLLLLLAMVPLAAQQGGTRVYGGGTDLPACENDGETWIYNQTTGEMECALPPGAGGGSGTVNAGTTGQAAYYAADGTAVSGEAGLLRASEANWKLQHSGAGATQFIMQEGGTQGGADLFQAKNAAGTLGFHISDTGRRAAVGWTAFTGTFTAGALSSTVMPLVVEAASGQTADLFHLKVNNAEVASIDAAGNVDAAGYFVAGTNISAIYQPVSAKGQANGYASLDGNTRVPTAQLGTGTADSTTFLRGDGSWQTPAGGGGTQSAKWWAGMVQGGVPSAGFSLPAANYPAAVDSSASGFLVATLAFDAATDESVQGVESLENWSTGQVDAQVTWFGSATTGNVRWALRTACVAAGEGIADLAWNTAAFVTSAAAATANDWTVASLANVPMTNCAEGERMVFQLYRDADDAVNDTYAADASLVLLELFIPRT